MSQFELIRRFLATQGVFKIVVVVQICTLILHIFLLYIFTIVYGHQVVAMSVITSLTHCLNLFILSMYITQKGDVIQPESWHCVNNDSFKGLYQYLVYGIPSTIMTILEFWCYEAFVLISGYIGINYQSAAVTLINIVATIYVLSVGMGMAATS